MEDAISEGGAIVGLACFTDVLVRGQWEEEREEQLRALNARLHKV